MTFYVDITRRRVGYSVQFGCDPGGNSIGWAEYPIRWRATYAGAVRYGVRRLHARVGRPEHVILAERGVVLA